MGHHLVLPIAPLSICPGHELGLFSVLELFELSNGAVQVNFGSRGDYEIDRDEMTGSLTVLSLDDKMGEHPCDGIYDHASQLAAGAIATEDLASNVEFRGLAHDILPDFLRSRKAVMSIPFRRGNVPLTPWCSFGSYTHRDQNNVLPALDIRD
jgi:hypothetical protein